MKLRMLNLTKQIKKVIGAAALIGAVVSSPVTAGTYNQTGMSGMNGMGGMSGMNGMSGMSGRLWTWVQALA